MTKFWIKLQLWWEGYCPIHLTEHRESFPTSYCIECLRAKFSRRAMKAANKVSKRQQRVDGLITKLQAVSDSQGNAERTPR